MSCYTPAITARGIEEVLVLTHSDLLELQELARCACELNAHTPTGYTGYCDECLDFVARLFAFRKEA